MSELCTIVAFEALLAIVSEWLMWMIEAKPAVFLQAHSSPAQIIQPTLQIQIPALTSRPSALTPLIVIQKAILLFSRWVFGVCRIILREFLLFGARQHRTDACDKQLSSHCGPPVVTEKV